MFRFSTLVVPVVEPVEPDEPGAVLGVVERVGLSRGATVTGVVRRLRGGM